RYGIDVIVGLAHDLQALCIPAFDRMVRIEIAVIADVQVEIAIEVEIGPGGAAPPQRVSTDRRVRYIGECSVALVSVERIGSNVGDEDVVEPVVVEITDGDPLAVSTFIKAARDSHRLEPAVPGISKELVGGTVGGRLCHRIAPL